MHYARFTFFILFLSAVIISCQKDDNDVSVAKSAKMIDSTNSLGVVSAPNNFLAIKGKLEITVQDSTYIFDAAKDSIAFVNVYLDNDKYFGITAINKEHTMSFGISSIGFAAPNLTSSIAGSQLLFSTNALPNIQYTLTRYAGPQDFGKINLEKYTQDSVLAKGTFFTFLAKDAKPNSPFYRVEGSFNLKLK
jgi:hypothetical protein